MALIGTINSPNDFGFKNRIINGAMVIDQRNAGASVTVSTSVNTFPVDRMALISTGATTTAQRVAGTGAYAYDVLYTGAASVTASYFFQRIESVNCLDLVSKNITFQVQLSSSTVTSVAVGLFSAGSTDNFASPVSISSTTFTITSTPTIYTWTVNAGANAANGLQIQLNFGAFTSGTARISGMQLEKGSTATSFDYRPYGTELQLCQRYYWQANMSNATVNYWMTCMSTNPLTSNNMQISLTTSLRTSPQFVLYPAYNTGGSWNLNNAIVNQTFSALPTILGSSPSSVAVNIQTSGGMNAGYPNYIYNNTGVAGYIALSAEL